MRRASHGRERAAVLTRELLEEADPPTAVFAASDTQAMGVLEAADALGVSVPGDLSVVGYDDIEIARYAGLTTIAQPLEESGAIGAHLLLAALDGASVPGRQLPVRLVVRRQRRAARIAAGKHTWMARGYVPDHTHGQRGSSCPRDFCTCCAWRCLRGLRRRLRR